MLLYIRGCSICMSMYNMYVYTTLYVTWCTLDITSYIVHCVSHDNQSTQHHTLYIAVWIVHRIIYNYTVFYTVHYCTVYTVHCTVYKSRFSTIYIVGLIQVLTHNLYYSIWIVILLRTLSLYIRIHIQRNNIQIRILI